MPTAYLNGIAADLLTATENIMMVDRSMFMCDYQPV